jgi:hypothetical protein
VGRLRVLVHCLRCLGAATTVLATEVPCANGVFAEWARENGKTAHQFDPVMSHNSNCRRSTSARLRTKVSPVRPADGNRSRGEDRRRENSIGSKTQSAMREAECGAL